MLMGLRWGGGPAALVAGVLATLLAVGACGSSSADETGPDTTGGLAVVASFYPLQYAAERVGGDAVSVTNLTKPGAEPHELELSPQDVATISDASLVVYLSGFQPAVDDAVDAQAGDRSFDVASAARLDLTVDDEHGQATDPHFWLDPTRLADVGDAMAEQMGRADPSTAETFTANAAALRTDLEAVDGEFRSGLSSCTDKNLVTSHEAFGYLAQRYGFTQVPITGLTPESEPDAATLARVSDFVRDNDVSTIYYETLVSPAIARTVAAETGARTAVLDPIEGITDDSAAADYLGVMRANLTALQTGQSCS